MEGDCNSSKRRVRGRMDSSSGSNSARNDGSARKCDNEDESRHDAQLCREGKEKVQDCFRKQLFILSWRGRQKMGEDGEEQQQQETAQGPHKRQRKTI
ncbi:hypothetical protein E4U46_000659, partial [Claviceps purpurea]